MDQDRASELSRKMMKKQLRLSLTIAVCFIVVLIGLPLFNLYMPDLAKTNIGGFSLTWLVLGLLFYPLTWVLSTWFVKGSETIEQQIIEEEKK